MKGRRSTDAPLRPVDGYRYPRKVVEGCQHRLGCRCDPPMWLREPSAAERKRFFIPKDQPE